MKLIRLLSVAVVCGVGFIVNMQLPRAEAHSAHASQHPVYIIGNIFTGAPMNFYNCQGLPFGLVDTMNLGIVKNGASSPNAAYPGLAKTWKLSKDGKSLTVNLQPNAKWSDGPAVTSHDLVVTAEIGFVRGTAQGFFLGSVTPKGKLTAVYKQLAGANGSTMIERDAHHRIIRENITTPPEKGEDLHLSIDADVQTHLYQFLSQHAQDMRFTGGAAVIMDVHTGEILAITSFPEYNNQAFTDGDNAAIAAASGSTQTPLLNRAVGGLYAPGSIVKPIFASAALNEKLISPDKQIHSIGYISVPNPYDPAHPSLFHDWTVHGWIDMRTALAVSSDEYFYTIGGGYGDQKGLGITKIDQYAQKFGLGTPTGIILAGERSGTIPTPAWKAQVFPQDPTWRIGDTYHTAIGQYGFQITPIQAVRYVAAIANGGTLYTPQLLASSTPEGSSVGVPDQYLEIVREGMHMAVTSDRPDATVKALSIACTTGSPGVAIGLGQGMYGSGSHRNMLGDRSGKLIEYDVYTTVDRSTRWNAMNTVSYLATSHETTDIPLYGRVPAGQSATAGTYSDTLLALVNF